MLFLGDFSPYFFTLEPFWSGSAARCSEAARDSVGDAIAAANDGSRGDVGRHVVPGPVRKARAAVCSGAHIISHSVILLIAPCLLSARSPTPSANE